MAGTGFSTIDYGALVFFFTSWIVYYWVINHSALRTKTISYHMAQHRRRWMYNMVHREPKMPDTLIQNTLQYGVLFFASTTILLIGALMAGLGASDQAIEMLADIPYVNTPSRTAWEIKVLMVIFIFTYAFFKFAWSYRLFNYVLVLVGAAPDRSVKQSMSDFGDNTLACQYTKEYLSNYADRVGQLHTLGARHFTTGLNCYFFALAAVSWFLDARLFIVSTMWVSIVLYRRAFRSKFLNILEGIDV